MDKREDIVEINLGELFSILLGRAFLIISAGLFFALVGLFVSKFVVQSVICEKKACLQKNGNETQIKLVKDAMLICEIKICS